MVEIYLKEFKKKFNPKSSNKNMRKTYELQLIMAQASDIADKDPVEQIKATLKMTNQMQEYITDILKLNDKQKEFLDDELENKETIELANHIAMRLMGTSEKDIEEIKEKQDTDAEKKALEKE